MAQFIPDTIDFSAYMQQTECQVKVKKASVFESDLLDSFDTAKQVRRPSMLLAKMRNALQFRPGEVTVWAGYNGHRKSMFTGQMTLDLCLQRERVLMASFEMFPASTLARMAQQCLAVAHPARSSLQAFSQWTDGRLWMFNHMGRISPEQCLAVCRYFADELKGTQVVIDSMMMVCASEESMDEQKQLATDLVRLAQETNLHVHLVAHCRKPQQGEDRPPTKYDLRGSAAISDQAHNVVTIWANKTKAAALERDPCDESALATPDALVSIEKQRNGKFEGKLKLWFDENSLRFCDDRTSAVEPYAIGADL